jgi:hypothetical protein
MPSSHYCSISLGWDFDSSAGDSEMESNGIFRFVALIFLLGVIETRPESVQSKQAWGDGEYILLLYPSEGQCFERISLLSFAISISDRFFRDFHGQWQMEATLGDKFGPPPPTYANFQIDADNVADFVRKEGMVLNSPPIQDEGDNGQQITRLVLLNITLSSRSCEQNDPSTCAPMRHHAGVSLAIHGCQNPPVEQTSEPHASKPVFLEGGEAILNVALNRPARQSSTARSNGGAGGDEWSGDAGLAVDGAASFDCAAQHEQHARTRGGSGNSGGSGGDWWEVDLEETRPIDRVDVWTELCCPPRGPAAYPPFALGPSPVPLAALALTEDRRAAGRVEWREESPIGLYTWRPEAAPGPVLARYVRVQRLRSAAAVESSGGGSGAAAVSDGLVLLEVQVRTDNEPD